MFRNRVINHRGHKVTYTKDTGENAFFVPFVAISLCELRGLDFSCVASLINSYLMVSQNVIPIKRKDETE